MSDSGQVRAFLAIELPLVLREHLFRCAGALPTTEMKGRLVPLDNLHLTIKFLGETVPAARVEALREPIATHVVSLRPFDLMLRGMLLLPTPQRARSVCAGVQGDLAALKVLQLRVEKAALEVGFAPEGRPYFPHVTLARLRQHPRPAIADEVTSSFANQAFGEFRVGSVTCFQSMLSATGATYRTLWSVGL